MAPRLTERVVVVPYLDSFCELHFWLIKLDKRSDKTHPRSYERALSARGVWHCTALNGKADAFTKSKKPKFTWPTEPELWSLFMEALGGNVIHSPSHPAIKEALAAS